MANRLFMKTPNKNLFGDKYILETMRKKYTEIICII